MESNNVSYALKTKIQQLNLLYINSKSQIPCYSLPTLRRRATPRPSLCSLPKSPGRRPRCSCPFPKRGDLGPDAKGFGVNERLERRHPRRLTRSGEDAAFGSKAVATSGAIPRALRRTGALPARDRRLAGSGGIRNCPCRVERSRYIDRAADAARSLRRTCRRYSQNYPQGYPPLPREPARPENGRRACRKPF